MGSKSNRTSYYTENNNYPYWVPRGVPSQNVMGYTGQNYTNRTDYSDKQEGLIKRKKPTNIIEEDIDATDFLGQIWPMTEFILKMQVLSDYVVKCQKN